MCTIIHVLRLCLSYLILYIAYFEDCIFLRIFWLGNNALHISQVRTLTVIIISTLADTGNEQHRTVLADD